jgi:hypothetical protein
VRCQQRSGHGFKHAAAIEEALGRRVLDGKSRIDISSFNLKGLKVSVIESPKAMMHKMLQFWTLR